MFENGLTVMSHFKSGDSTHKSERSGKFVMHLVDVLVKRTCRVDETDKTLATNYFDLLRVKLLDCNTSDMQKQRTRVSYAEPTRN